MADYIPPVQVSPNYFIASVDNALRLIQIIRDDGKITVKEAANRLEVAPSTAHRLLAMLVYRGFALQDDERSYIPGPALIPVSINLVQSGELRQTLMPELERVAKETGESFQVSVLTGTNIHIIAAVEGSSPGAIDSREGSVMPAHRTSTGKAILAHSDLNTVEAVLTQALTQGQLSSASLDNVKRRIMRDLAVSKVRGYALNQNEFEPNITTVGFHLAIPGKPPILAFCVGTPSYRVSNMLQSEVLEQLFAVQRRLEDVLASKFSVAE